MKKGKQLPTDIQPMLATLVNKPFNDNDWLYEIKWDGYRALAFIDNGKVELKSRNNKSFNEKFYPIYQALQQWKMKAILDGEILVINSKGLPDFGALQTWRSEADGDLYYYVFDILWHNERDIMQLPLTERKEILRAALPENDFIRISDAIIGKGNAFFSLAEKMELEGIIAKRADSKYTPGIRSKEWLKIKTEKRKEAIIGGYTRNENTSKLFSALLLGAYEDGKFRFIGPVGTGFNIKIQEEILRKLKPYVTAKCPFASVPEYNKPSRFRPNPPRAYVTWVKPKLVAEISYRQLTPDGAIRHPSFKGLREDKRPEEVVREHENETEAIIRKADLQKIKTAKPPEKKERKTLLNPTDETQVRAVAGHELKFTNLSKIYWPKEKITKRDMINYYYQIAPYMLPYLKGRPQTLNRHPHGISGETFYQKNVSGKVPAWMETFPYYSETDHRQKEFLVCTDEASLLYMASLGCIEINPWSSSTQSPDRPDWCIIDLDPDRNTFDQVITAANVVKDVLEAAAVNCCCKTSGSSGLHIYVPLGAKYTYDESKEFARLIAKIVHAQIPKFTSIERMVSNRACKMYIDFLQNRPQATIAAPYSLRPRPGATVSAPLHWDEVKKGLKMKDYNIRNMPSRLNETGDLFKAVLGKGIEMAKVVKRLERLFKIA